MSSNTNNSNNGGKNPRNNSRKQRGQSNRRNNRNRNRNRNCYKCGQPGHVKVSLVVNSCWRDEILSSSSKKFAFAFGVLRVSHSLCRMTLFFCFIFQQVLLLIALFVLSVTPISGTVSQSKTVRDSEQTRPYSDSPRHWNNHHHHWSVSDTATPVAPTATEAQTSISTSAEETTTTTTTETSKSTAWRQHHHRQHHYHYHYLHLCGYHQYTTQSVGGSIGVLLQRRKFDAWSVSS